MKKIDQLTKVQEGHFSEFVQKWTEIGICTKPADRTSAEEGIMLAYHLAGLSPPRKIVWCDSPLSQGLTRTIVLGLAENTEVKVGDSVRDSVWDSCYGQHDANWLAFYDYFSEVCGLSEETQKLTGLWRIAKSANWWLPHQHICWVSERHHTLCRDDRGRLHCENGPALQYPDGWGIWAWHGVFVSQDMIEHPEKITISQITDEQNEEVRRIMIERMGWPRYLRETNSKVIHQRRNDIEATEEALMESPGGKVLVCACPSTAKVFALGVPSEIKTCMEAQNWLSGGLSSRIVSAS